MLGAFGTLSGSLLKEVRTETSASLDEQTVPIHYESSFVAEVGDSHG